jgi:hypothetical protein
MSQFSRTECPFDKRLSNLQESERFSHHSSDPKDSILRASCISQNIFGSFWQENDCCNIIHRHIVIIADNVLVNNLATLKTILAIGALFVEIRTLVYIAKPEKRHRPVALSRQMQLRLK